MRKEPVTYTRRDFDRYFARRAGVKNKEAQEISKHYLRALSEFLRDMQIGDRLEIRGLGVFNISYLPARTNVRNPKTGERAIASARRRLKFKPSRILKTAFKTLYPGD